MQLIWLYRNLDTFITPFPEISNAAPAVTAWAIVVVGNGRQSKTSVQPTQICSPRFYSILSYVNFKMCLIEIGSHPFHEKQKYYGAYRRNNTQTYTQQEDHKFEPRQVDDAFELQKEAPFAVNGEIMIISDYQTSMALPQ